MVKTMTNEQQAIYLQGLLKKLREARKNAETTLLQEYPDLKSFWGNLNSKALRQFIAIEGELEEEIALLTPKFP